VRKKRRKKTMGLTEMLILCRGRTYKIFRRAGMADTHVAKDIGSHYGNIGPISFCIACRYRTPQYRADIAMCEEKISRQYRQPISRFVSTTILGQYCFPDQNRSRARQCRDGIVIRYRPVRRTRYFTDIVVLA